MHIFSLVEGLKVWLCKGLDILHDSDVNMFADVIQARRKQI